ncbi:MAG TPA: alpha/beta hydrolase [Vicinamibacterales bacterium]|nr:alpha/beta hydrolase [Vicinamibacterales bacterium]
MVIFAEAETSLPAASLDLVRLSNGVTLHYAHQGPQSGPALVMLHGFTDSWFSFSRVLPLLPPDLRVIVPDLRGHGDSERPETGYRLTDFADDVIKLMDALQVPKAVLVGHSMGSFVARKVNELAPARVARLVLVGAGLLSANAATSDLAQSVSALTDPVDEAFVREFQFGTINGDVPGSFMEVIVANSRRTPARIWRAALQGMLDDAIKLSRPNVRTLVVGGRQDSIFSSTEQMVLARQFPRGELHLIDGVGHALHWERPESFVNALIRFGV